MTRIPESEPTQGDSWGCPGSSRVAGCHFRRTQIWVDGWPCDTWGWRLNIIYHSLPPGFSKDFQAVFFMDGWMEMVILNNHFIFPFSKDVMKIRPIDSQP